MQTLQVAVAVVVDGEGRVLVALRPDDKHQGGRWEFPGGKVEDGESVTDALARELAEEVALEVGGTEPLLVIEHDYGDRHVCLDVHLVTAYRGEATGQEGQPLRWLLPAELDADEFPAANVPIIAAIRERLG
ncbi:8-oxo-dGTP diphosphatase MutT [Pseudohaliea rubra]|uniref:8-oxo-dGTP diphosphatase n=1 Tax=Pseudohaliea rubra DSM 19751 TaxID=1265313 RepID=A0A095X362_9GAMM|nr:8-oxo-dGTP diphosphatase MutT [Pseudohaliea rubra]KGE05319.1 Mutator mutT protein/ Thiamin-phosphate pyrophosphorylase-like protein [Pseudohaliea rubra DSM 19751]